MESRFAFLMFLALIVAGCSRGNEAADPRAAEKGGDEPAEIKIVAIEPTAAEKAAIEAALADVHSKDAVARKRALKTLGEFGPKATAAIPELLKASMPGRMSADGDALGAIKQIGPAAVPMFVDAWKTGDDLTQMRVVMAAKQIGPPAGALTGAICERLLQEKNGLDRDLMLQALTSMGPGAKTAVPTMIKLLEAKDPARRRIIEALGKIGPAAAPAIPLVFKTSERGQSQLEDIAIIETIGSAAVPQLIPLLNDPNPDIQGQAFYFLGKLGPKAKDAVPALRGFLDDKNDGTRVMAMSILGSIGPDAKAAAPALRPLMKDPKFSVLAAASLIAIEPSDKGALDVLIGALERKQNVRQACDALARVGPAAKPALPTLKKLLADDKLQGEPWKAILSIGPEAAPIVADAFRTKSSAGHWAKEYMQGYPKTGAQIVAVLMQDKDVAVRMGAVDAVRRAGYNMRPYAEPMVPKLAALLKDSDPERRDAVVVALGHLGPAAKGALPDLIALMPAYAKDRTGTLQNTVDRIDRETAKKHFTK